MRIAVAERETFQSSDLSRHASRVFAAAEAHPILVTRRDGESLVLMTERESQARERLLEFAAQIITAATDERGTLAQRMAAQLPWMHALTAEDQATCADDLLRAARAALATNQAHLAVAELTSWRETATAIAAGFTPPTAEWLDDEPNVERP